ncbi:MAG TPA: TolC family protein [Myxococcaceae bacterium]|nr:TolC family protein [Myxococcaceae bacterium]
MTPPTPASGLLLAGLLCSPVALAAPEMTITDAIRTAWTHDARLQASSAQATSASRSAEAADWALGPTVVLGAQGTITSQPSRHFALLLDQGQLTAADFDPARLNTPSVRGSLGLSAVVEQPLIDPGLWAASRRAHAGAEAEEAGRAVTQARVALETVRAYFSVRAAEEALVFAEDALRAARDTERFLRARVEQDVLLASEGSRSTAYRAQAEAERAAAVRQLALARTGFVMLVGQDPAPGMLVTPLVPPETAVSAEVQERPEARAARAAVDAQAAAADEAHGRLWPTLLLQGGVATERAGLSEGTTWGMGFLILRWRGSVAGFKMADAAESTRVAAEARRLEQERMLAAELEQARASLDAAAAALQAARTAVAASEQTRTLRQARHRQGLIPLTELLDAETGLTSARALLLRSALQARLARAELENASGQAVEGVRP